MKKQFPRTRGTQPSSGSWTPDARHPDGASLRPRTPPLAMRRPGGIRRRSRLDVTPVDRARPVQELLAAMPESGKLTSEAAVWTRARGR
jgi:hypothetical protein